MSLGCGACRRTIYGSFGFLYRLVLDGDAFAYEDKTQDYVPPNGALCTECWRASPLVDEAIDEEAALTLARLGDRVYAYRRADSLDGNGGAAQWSSACGFGTYTYYRQRSVEDWSPNLVQVIGWDASGKHTCAQEDCKSGRPRARELALYAADPINKGRVP